MSSPVSLTDFIDERIKALAPIRSQKEIASLAGFPNPNVISMLKTGTTKLALERVEQLASALDCDPRKLMRLALAQHYEEPVIKQIINCAVPTVTPAEQLLIEAIRALHEEAKKQDNQIAIQAFRQARNVKS